MPLAFSCRNYGHGIFNERKELHACCTHEGETGTDESTEKPVRTRKNDKTVLRCVACQSGATATGFTVHSALASQLPTAVVVQCRPLTDVLKIVQSSSPWAQSSPCSGVRRKGTGWGNSHHIAVPWCTPDNRRSGCPSNPGAAARTCCAVNTRLKWPSVPLRSTSQVVCKWGSLHAVFTTRLYQFFYIY